MGDEQRFVIFDECRDFTETHLEARLETARNFVREFIRSIKPPKAEDESDEAWTRSVRKRFIDMCPSDCDPLPADPCSRIGEYLVDYTWSENKSGKRVLLAAESEWGTVSFTKTHWDPVETDFEKLLAIKAPFKVLIFSSVRNLEEKESGVNFPSKYAKMRLTVSLENYGHHLPGEVYIFVDLPQMRDPVSEGGFDSWVWISKTYGKQKVEFDPLEHGGLVRPASPIEPRDGK